MAKRKQKTRKKRGCGLRLIGVIFAALMYIGLAVTMFLLVLFHLISGAEVFMIPDLVGMNIAEIEPLGLPEDFHLTVIDQSCSEPEGTIIDQNVMSGKDIKLPYYLEVTVSRGREERPVPDLQNLPLSLARELIQQEGLVLGSLQSADMDTGTVLPGAVLESDPQAGTMLELGGKVNLVIRSEQRYAMIRVPDLRGHQFSNVASVLRELGLSFSEEHDLEEKLDYDHLPGTVLEQFPEAGATVPGGTGLHLVIAHQPSSSRPATRMVPLYFVTPPGLGQYEVRVMVNDSFGAREVFREVTEPGRHLMLQLRVSGDATASVFIGGELHKVIPLE